MLIQFVSFVLYNAGQLQDRGDHEDHLSYKQLVTEQSS